MPIPNNSIGSFSIGRDVSLVIVHPNAPGGRVDLSGVTDFDCKPDMAEINSMLLTGKSLTVYIPKRWTGSFMLDRVNRNIDALVGGIESGWFSGGLIQFGQMFQYVKEADGSTSTFGFADLALKLGDAGKWKADALVKLTLEFASSGRTAL